MLMVLDIHVSRKVENSVTLAALPMTSDLRLARWTLDWLGSALLNQIRVQFSAWTSFHDRVYSRIYSIYFSVRKIK